MIRTDSNIDQTDKKMKTDLDNIFKSKRQEFDFAEPEIGHFERFESRMKQQGEKSNSKKNIFWPWLAIAATVLIFFGYWMGNYNSQNKGLELADVSPKMEETQNFYLVSIQKEIEQIKSQETPENKKIIEDSFLQLKNLENDYQKLKLQLQESNEDKRVIFAMVVNFQNRVVVLQNLLEQLEDFDSIRNVESQI